MITWCFFGEHGRRALTIDEGGRNLPREYAPWHRFRIIDLTGSDPDDAEIVEHIKKRGFYLFAHDGVADA